MERMPDAWRVVDAIESEPEAAGPARPTAGGRPALLLLLVAAVALAGGALAVSAVVVLQGGAGASAGDGSGARAAAVLPAERPASSALSGSAPAPPSGQSPAAWLVDVGGAVRRPGLYRLPPGSRVGDAITAAGGYGPRVDAAAAAATLNLAEELRDGAKVVVPERGATAGAGTPVPVRGADPPPQSASRTGSGAIDLNHASATELDSLPGIGPATSAKIIASRETEPFQSVDDLLTRKLVRQSVMEQIRGLVRVGG